MDAAELTGAGALGIPEPSSEVLVLGGLVLSCCTCKLRGR
jgi:hypothetical protein